MLLNINYKTEYKIEGILNEGYQRVILIPKSSNSQKIIEWDLNIEGGIKEINSKDHFSNSVNLIRMNDDTNTINISVRGKVETINCNGVFNDYKDSLPIWSYTQQTKLTMPGKEFKKFFKKVPFKNDNLIEYLHSLSNYIRDKIEYIPGTTNYKTTAEEAVKIRKGVCQDHTHIFLSLVRMDNLPCRYVSGFFLPETKNQDLAMHAWAEVYIDDLGWVGFDISNGISPDEKYVSVAKGYDYNDVVPIKGVLKGMFREKHKSKLSIKSINE